MRSKIHRLGNSDPNKHVPSEFHLYLENPPQDMSERWSGRPFRAFTVVHPPGPPNLNSERAESDKKAFLENLWTAQAKYRTKENLSVVIRSEDQEVDSRGGRITVASTFYNVYQRTDFMKERRKVVFVTVVSWICAHAVELDESGGSHRWRWNRRPNTLWYRGSSDGCDTDTALGRRPLKIRRQLERLFR